MHEALPSSREYGYRNKMEFSFSERRWLLPQEMGQEGVDTGMALGLHVPGTFDQVIDIKQCEIMPAQGNEILNDVREFIKTSGLPAYHLRSHEGFWRFLMLRHSFAMISGW